jgi:trans-aconitate methyltransferase
MTTPPVSPAAFTFGRTRDWPGYFEAVKGGEPRQTLLDAMALFDAQPAPDAPRAAIDLGCGDGRDTVALLAKGWSVLAIDGHPQGIERLLARPDLPGTDRLQTRVQSFEQLDALPGCDLLNASFALPFCHPEHFDRLWTVITGCIRTGGRFAGQLFGERDEWSDIADRSHVTRSQAERLLGGFLLELFREEEKDATDAASNHKHWHVFHIVARKR